MPDLGERVHRENQILSLSRAYEKTLADTLARPFPERQKGEELNRFVRRVDTFLVSTFHNTSPAREAKQLHGRLGKSGAALGRVACAECERFLAMTLGTPAPASDAARGGAQQEQAQQELETLAGPYLQALQTFKLLHARVLKTFPPVRVILRRDHGASRGQALLKAARNLFRAEGKIVRFGTPLWDSAEEHEQLLRFDTELGRLYEQIPWLQEQVRKLEQRAAALKGSHFLSLRKALIAALCRRLAEVEPMARAVLVKRVLEQKGVGSWLWRLFYA